MGRKKIEMEYVEDRRSRKNKFWQRKQGLLKKATELGVLCGVKITLAFTDTENNLLVFSNTTVLEVIVSQSFTEQYPTSKLQTLSPKDYPFPKQSQKEISRKNSGNISPLVQKNIPNFEQKRNWLGLDDLQKINGDINPKKLKIKSDCVIQTESLVNKDKNQKDDRKDQLPDLNLSLDRYACSSKNSIPLNRNINQELSKKIDFLKEKTRFFVEKDRWNYSLPFSTLNIIFTLYFTEDKNPVSNLLKQIPKKEILKLLEIGNKEVERETHQFLDFDEEDLKSEFSFSSLMRNSESNFGQSIENSKEKDNIDRDPIHQYIDGLRRDPKDPDKIRSSHIKHWKQGVNDFNVKNIPFSPPEDRKLMDELESSIEVILEFLLGKRTISTNFDLTIEMKKVKRPLGRYKAVAKNFKKSYCSFGFRACSENKFKDFLSLKKITTKDLNEKQKNNIVAYLMMISDEEFMKITDNYALIFLQNLVSIGESYREYYHFIKSKLNRIEKRTLYPSEKETIIMNSSVDPPS